jgi:hypothetical protein
MTTPLFDGLFDDAALFPPGDAPMAVAVPAHRELRQGLGALVGPFVVPGARLDELVEHLGDGPVFDVSLIANADDLPGAVGRCAREPRLRLAAVEVPAVHDLAEAVTAFRVLSQELDASVPAAVELPRSPARAGIVDLLAGTRYRAKIRTGGVRADQFPDETELAGTLIGCISRAVPFKCTAGLHHAVRHTDPSTGFEHQGFLNILVAVESAATGAARHHVAELLAERDGAALARRVDAWTSAQRAHVRALFTSFGTCSVTEPVEDLLSLGLVPAPERIPA